MSEVLDPAGLYCWICYWLERSGEVLCSCGNIMDECKFWKPVCDELR